MTLHRIVIGMAIALCVAYAAFELAHAGGHGAGRVVAGVAAPLVAVAGLAWYLARIGRRGETPR